MFPDILRSLPISRFPFAENVLVALPPIRAVYEVRSVVDALTTVSLFSFSLKEKLAFDARVSAAVVYKTVFVPPNVESPVPPDATGRSLPRVSVPLVSNAMSGAVDVAEVAADEVAK